MLWVLKQCEWKGGHVEDGKSPRSACLLFVRACALYEHMPCACTSICLVLVRACAFFLYEHVPCTCTSICLLLVRACAFYLYEHMPCTCTSICLLLVRAYAFYLYEHMPSSCTSICPLLQVIDACLMWRQYTAIYNPKLSRIRSRESNTPTYTAIYIPK